MTIAVGVMVKRKKSEALVHGKPIKPGDIDFRSSEDWHRQLLRKQQEKENKDA